jgi:hypothetical protein
MPKHKQLMHLLENADIRKLHEDVEMQMLSEMHKERARELRDELYFTISERTREVSLTDRGCEKICPSDPKLFVLPDLAAEMSAIDGDATLSVTTNTGKTIPDEEVYNYRQFFKTLLSIAIQGYAPLTDEEIKALAVEENCILTFTINELSGKSTVYKFYPYSSTGRRALMTVNGHGEFYVQTDLIEKIASDANKVLNDLDVDSYGKN